MTMQYFISIIGKKTSECIAQCELFSDNKTNKLLAPWKLGSIKESKYLFCGTLFTSVNWALDYGFQLL